jgi:hypothetical protein
MSQRSTTCPKGRNSRRARARPGAQLDDLLARAAGYRDPETGEHLVRMSNYTRIIAAHLGLPEEQDLLLSAAPMHDIGKMGIPDHILLKPGRLDEEELKVMRLHAQIGADILRDSPSPLLQTASGSPARTMRNGMAAATPMASRARISRSTAASWRWPTCSMR